MKKKRVFTVTVSVTDEESGVTYKETCEMDKFKLFVAEENNLSLAKKLLARMVSNVLSSIPELKNGKNSGS